MKALKRARTWLTVFLVLMIVELATYVALEVFGIFEKDYHYLEIVFAIVNPIIIVIFFVCLIFYLNSLNQYKDLQIENLYNLGVASGFYNYHVLENMIRRKRMFKYKNAPAYVVAISASNQAVMQSSLKNSVISKLNYEISGYITRYFIAKGKKTFKKNSFCFYHGMFILYSFMKNEEVEEFISAFEADVFKLAEEHQIHVFVQPFFGVYEVNNPKEEVFLSVDNAITACNYSDKNFQTKSYYSDEMRKGVSQSDIEEISEALENDEFVVYYQPKYSLNEKKFISSEALVRWNSPKYGLVSPGKFISKAEIGGIIHEIDMFVFRRVCEDLSETKRKGRRMLPVSVNFSLYEFYTPNFLDDLMKILKQFDLDTKFIEIEITETTSQANSFLAVSILKKIKEQGLNILMDDFGVGYSNINNLNKLPIDKVKIDKSFIDNITSDPKTRDSVRFLIELCKNNGMESIAEGVDSQAQVDILKKIKCDTIQGFFYSKPIPKEEYEKFLVSNMYEKNVKGGN